MAGIVFTEGSGLNDSIFGKSQAPIRAFIESKAEAFENASMIDTLFAVEKSNTWGEKFGSMTAMEGFKPVGENGEHPHDSMQEGYSKTIQNMTWKDQFSISREIIDDGKLIDLKSRPQAFITGYYRTRELFAAALYGAAISGKKELTYGGMKFDVSGADGKAIFDTAHQAKVKGANQSNKFADAFSNDALMALESKMQDFRDDNGNVLNVAPTTILIPNDYQIKKDVFEAIGADQDPETSNNGFNYNFGRWNVIVWQYLNQFITAGSKPWVLLDEQYNKNNYGAIWLNRNDLEVKSIVDNNTDANVWLGYSRFTGGFSDWRFAAVGGISGGSTLIGA